MSMDLDRAAAAVRDLLLALGEDPERDGLQATPARVAKAWGEQLRGYTQNPAEVLKTSNGTKGFEASYDGMIVLAGYPVHSTCEHHLLPFMGLADVGYMPAEGGKVVGLSKLGRLVDLYASRLQMQERLTQQVAHALREQLEARGVGVRVRAVHLCMECRGVRKSGTMSTESLLGCFQEHAVRSEFWHLCEPLPRGIR